MNEILLVILRYTLLICIIFFVFLPFVIQSQIYYPSKQLFLVNIKYEDVFILTRDNIKINGWYSAPKDCEAEVKQNRSDGEETSMEALRNSFPKDITVLFCHGNGGNLSFYNDLIELLQENGYGIFAIDYRGYGKSAGKPDEEGLYAELRSAVKYLKEEKNTPEEKIVLWGLSLGGAVVSQIASENDKFKGVILQSTFTSIKDMTSNVVHRAYLGIKSDYRNFFSDKLIKLIPTFQKFETRDRINKIKSRLLIAHAFPDNIVPVEMSKELAGLNSKAEVFISKEGGHNEQDWFYPKLLEFLNSLE